MRNPLAAWRAGVRWPLGLLSVFAAIVLIIGICEALGWPFLVGPIQHRLALALDRRIVFGDGEGGSSGVRIGLIGSVRVTASSIEIGAPSWSQAPHMMLARDATLKLGYLDLWRAWRGEALHIDSLEASHLDGVIERLADGRASWQFGSKAPVDTSDKPARIPTFGTLRVGEGSLAVRDALLPAKVDANFSLSDGTRIAGVTPTGSAASSGAGPASAAGNRGISVRAGGSASTPSGTPGAPADVEPVDSGFRLSATGTYKQFPLRIDLLTSGLLTFFGSDAAPAQPLRLLASIGRARLSFDGSTTDPLHFTGLSGKFTLAGSSLAAVGDPIGVTLPTTPAFDTRGTLVKDGKLWKVQFDEATIGSSRLDGDFTYDTRLKVPLLSGRLGGSRLVLADLGPAVGTAPASASGASAPSPTADTARGGRVIPDKKFDLPSLRAMDANVVIDIGMFDPGTTVIEPLRPARAHLLLADGVLTIADFEGVTAQGRLLGYLQLDGRGTEALWTADMRLLGVNLAQWLRLKRSGDAPPYLSGKLDAQVKVKGTGRSTAEILASLNGGIRAHMRDAAISHLAIEAAGIDVAQALGVLIKGDDGMAIQCNVADLNVANGVIKPNVFILNTKDSTVWIDGTVSLRDEGLDLRAVVSPKDFSPLALRTPIHVRGTLGKPAVSLDYGKLATKGAAAGLLALLNPLAAIIPFIDTGSKDEARKAGAECAALVPTKGVIAAPIRNPVSAKIPAASLAPAADPTTRK